MSNERAAPVWPVALAAVGLSTLACWHSLGLYLPSFNSPKTSIEGVAPVKSSLPQAPSIARRLVVVILDGLGFDSAREVESLAALRRQGVFRSLAVELPSYTSPAVTSIFTGVSPRDSGIRRNGGGSGVPLESILETATEAGVPTSIFSRTWDELPELSRAPKETKLFEGHFAEVIDLVRREADGAPTYEPIEGKSPARALDVYYFGDTDHAGHAHGARSPEYKEAAELGGLLASHVAASLDLEQDSLVVLSDHGHTPTGGHGGSEDSVTHATFLGVGGFFRRGVELSERPMRDVASTLAVVAGIRVPGKNLGLPMLDALTLDDQQTSFLLAAPFEEAARFSCAAQPSPRCSEIDPLVPRLHEPNGTLWPDAQELYADLSGERDRELSLEREAGATRRMAITAALEAVLLAGAVGLLARAKKLAGAVGPGAILAALANALVFAGFLYARGYRPTFSLMPPAPLFMEDAAIGAVPAAIVAALVAWKVPSGRLGAWATMIAATFPFAMLAAYVGWDPRTAPPPVAGVVVFLLAPTIVSASLAAVLVTVLRRRAARSPA